MKFLDRRDVYKRQVYVLVLTVIGIQDGTQMIKISLVYYMKILKFVIIFLKNLKQLQ